MSHEELVGCKTNDAEKRNIKYINEMHYDALNLQKI